MTESIFGLPVVEVPLASFLAPSPQLQPLFSSGPRRGMLAALIGPPGCGKSSFCAQWPEPEACIEIRDQGMIDLADEALISLPRDRIHLADTFSKYLNNLRGCLTSSSKTVICESISGVQALCWEHASKTDYDNDLSNKKFLNFQAGPITACERHLQAIVDTMLALQSAGKHVWFVGHTLVKADQHAESEDTLKNKISVDKRMSAKIMGSFTNVFHIADVVSPVKEVSKTTVKVSSDFTRWIYPAAHPHFDAKNRIGLRAEFQFPNDPKTAYLVFCEKANRDPKTGYRKL